MEKMIIPFSCGTEAMDWQYNNCDQCKRAYKPKNGNDYPDFDETEKLVSQGKECKLKYHIDYGFIIGEIPEYIGKQVGLSESGGLKDSCMMFIENNDRGWRDEDEPKPVSVIPDHQLCFPFIMDEIINSGVKEKQFNVETK